METSREKGGVQLPGAPGTRLEGGESLSLVPGEGHHCSATSMVLSFALSKKWIWDSQKGAGKPKEKGTHGPGGGLSVGAQPGALCYLIQWPPLLHRPAIWEQRQTGWRWTEEGEL